MFGHEPKRTKQPIRTRLCPEKVDLYHAIFHGVYPTRCGRVRRKLPSSQNCVKMQTTVSRVAQTACARRAYHFWACLKPQPRDRHGFVTRRALGRARNLTLEGVDVGLNHYRTLDLGCQSLGYTLATVSTKFHAVLRSFTATRLCAESELGSQSPKAANWPDLAFQTLYHLANNP